MLENFLAARERASKSAANQRLNRITLRATLSRKNNPEGVDETLQRFGTLPNLGMIYDPLLYALYQMLK